jgi:hypothetical protein
MIGVDGRCSGAIAPGKNSCFYGVFSGIFPNRTKTNAFPDGKAFEG